MSEEYYRAPPIPGYFIWRKLHSLMGIWLVLFLIEHLFTNSQAALYIGENGKGFVRAVDWLKNLPYLQVIEITLLAIPFLIHGLLGVRYLFTARYNHYPTDGAAPALTSHKRNHAYAWQRITSWVLLIGIVTHVVQMRFINYPAAAQISGKTDYMLPVTWDKGLVTLKHRLDFKFYDQSMIESMEQTVTKAITTLKLSAPSAILKQTIDEKQKWLKALRSHFVEKDQVLIITPSFGTAELLMVRDTFKSPLMMILYTALVLAASFHAFNGLWTAMISWGVTLTVASQNLMRSLTTGLMALITLLGLAAIWGTYWFNLYR